MKITPAEAKLDAIQTKMELDAEAQKAPKNPRHDNGAPPPKKPGSGKSYGPLICVALIIIGIIVYDYFSCTQLPSEPPSLPERAIDMRHSGSH
ncbi:hypothetical protein K8R04_01020 [Candidatus Uhrbacteria bacterium]|nr:hypothetical protein [Candidatus Uhrbacteria bacterium]